MNWRGALIATCLYWVLPLLCTAVQLWLVWHPDPLPSSRAWWRRFGLAALLLSRCGLVVILYGLLGFRDGNDFQIWVEHNAMPILEGKVPGRDFSNNYGPLFPYLQAIGVWLMPGKHPAGVLLPFLAGDLLVVLTGPRLAARLRGSADPAWIGLWLLSSQLLWYQLVMRGQDEALFAGSLMLSCLLVVVERPAAAGACLALGLLSTKISYAPYAMSVMAASFAPGVRWGRLAAAFGATVSIVVLPMGASMLRGLSTRPLDSQSSLFGIGLGIPDLLRSWVGVGSPAVAAVLYAGAILGALGLAHRLLSGFSTGWRLVGCVALTHCVTMLLAPYCVAPYLAQGAAFVLVFLGAVDSLPRRRAALTLLALAELMATVWWQLEPVSQEALRLISIVLHVSVLALGWHCVRCRTRDAAAGAGPAPVPGGNPRLP